MLLTNALEVKYQQLTALSCWMNPKNCVPVINCSRALTTGLHFITMELTQA